MRLQVWQYDAMPVAAFFFSNLHRAWHFTWNFFLSYLYGAWHITCDFTRHFTAQTWNWVNDGDRKGHIGQ